MLKKSLALLLSAALLGLSAFAADEYDDRDDTEVPEKPYYTFENVYDKDMGTYMLNVYVTSSNIIEDGALGIKLDDTIEPEWNDYDADMNEAGYMTVSSSFSMQYADELSLFADEMQSSNYVLLSWKANEPLFDS